MTFAEPIPRFLASVTSPDEARIALAGGAVVIDAKNPDEGALGALPVETVAAIRCALPPNVTLSATVGDLPAEPEAVVPAVLAMAESGCDLIKIGLFPGGRPREVIAALGALDIGAVRLVGLLLADRSPDFGHVAHMAKAGFAGVMVDTEGKAGGSLTDHMSMPRLEEFIREAHKHQLFAGIAGSLRVSHLPRLVPLKPDVIGFRGALCGGSDRTSPIEVSRVQSVRRAIESAIAATRPGIAAAAT